MVAKWHPHFREEILISDMSDISWCPILDKLSIISSTRPPRRLVLVSKLPSNYILGRNFNFRHVSHQLMSNIGQILDKCWKLSFISATVYQLISNIEQILDKCWIQSINQINQNVNKSSSYKTLAVKYRCQKTGH